MDWFDILQWRVIHNTVLVDDWNYPEINRKLKQSIMSPIVIPCVPSSFTANRQVPKFSWNNCAQSCKKMFMCPKFWTNPALKYTKCHISTNLLNFLKLCFLHCKKLFALAPTNRRFAEKNRLSGNTGHPSLSILQYGTAGMRHLFNL